MNGKADPRLLWDGGLLVLASAHTSTAGGTVRTGLGRFMSATVSVTSNITPSGVNATASNC